MVEIHSNVKLNILESLDLADIRLLHIISALAADEAVEKKNVLFVKSQVRRICDDLLTAFPDEAVLEVFQKIERVIFTLLTQETLISNEMIAKLSKSFDALRSWLETGATTESEWMSKSAELSQWLDGFEESSADLPAELSQYKEESITIRALLVCDNAATIEARTDALCELGIDPHPVPSSASALFSILGDNDAYDVIVVCLEDQLASESFLKIVDELAEGTVPSLRRKVVALADDISYSRLKTMVNMSCVYSVLRTSGSTHHFLKSVLGALSYKGKFINPLEEKAQAQA